MNRTIEVPADAKTVTLELKRTDALTLRSLLPRIADDVELVVEDAFGRADVDQYSLRACSGDSLLHKLMRSRVVEGESLLGLAPLVQMAPGRPTLINGSECLESGTSRIRLFVTWPTRPDGEG